VSLRVKRIGNGNVESEKICPFPSKKHRFQENRSFVGSRCLPTAVCRAALVVHEVTTPKRVMLATTGGVYALAILRISEIAPASASAISRPVKFPDPKWNSRTLCRRSASHFSSKYRTKHQAATALVSQRIASSIFSSSRPYSFAKSGIDSRALNREAITAVQIPVPARTGFRKSRAGLTINFGSAALLSRTKG
jgi:hypothetical protein